MKRFSLLFFLIVLSFTIAANVQAHEPRIVPDNELVLIKNPDISQAFYGELKGQPAYYLINLKTAGDLYLQILVPDLPGILKDKGVVITYSPELGQKAVNFSKLDPKSAGWEKFYEEYAGDNYLNGPEIKEPAEPGYYFIKVESPENEGKYVLVVGQKEAFPILESVKALVAIPILKVNFFNKPVWYFFEGKIGRYVGFALLGLLILGLMFYKFNQVYK